MKKVKSYYLEDIILNLHTFWKEQKCLIAESYDTEVGAGTFHPFTFFKCLGKKPWRTAYVQISRRPADGRYAENPLRMQRYFQYQVILKPAPKDVKEIYKKSLRFLGLDLASHDLRFVKDDWSSPTLGARGLGWEVWLDSLEITQFTYFLEVGDIELYPISCEITYGLERIAMLLQNKKDVYEIEYKKGISYKDLFKDYEIQFCEYNFKFAPVKVLLEEFSYNEKLISELLKKDLLFPAYELVLRNSHIFNLLDARGAISQIQRPDFIKRIRFLAKNCALKYLEKYE